MGSCVSVERTAGEHENPISEQQAGTRKSGQSGRISSPPHPNTAATAVNSRSDVTVTDMRRSSLTRRSEAGPSSSHPAPTFSPERVAAADWTESQRQWWATLTQQVESGGSGSHSAGSSPARQNASSSSSHLARCKLFAVEGGKETASELDELFSRCCAPQQASSGGHRVISGEGLATLMSELQIAREAHLMVLLWRLLGDRPTEEWSVDVSQWRRGWCAHGIFSRHAAATFAASQAAAFDGAPLSDPLIKGVFRFCFKFSRKEGRKAMALDDAAVVVETVLGGKWALCAPWCAFMTGAADPDVSPRRKVVVADEWDQLPDFAATYPTATALAAHDPATSSFPTLMDSFATWCKRELAKPDNGAFAAL